MKHWGSALFPLSILLALTLLTFWLRYATELDEPRRDGKHRHDPDYIVSDAVLRKIDANGQLKYTLRAAEARHFPDDDTTDLLKPHLTQQPTQQPDQSKKKAPVTVSADKGHLSNDNKRVDLTDNVFIHRPATDRDEELTASMPDLTVFPDDERAVTKSPVVLTKGRSWVKGVGMQVDNKAQTYLLESQVTGLLDRKPARKTKP